MKPHFYLLNLRMLGIKNIEEPIELSFYKKTIANDFNPDKYRIKAIYGENGSGKTAIISAVRLLQNLIIDRNYLADSDTQRSILEMVNKKKKKGFAECEFYTEINKEKVISKYYIEFEIKEDERFYIVREKLECKNGKYSKNAYITVYETEKGALVQFGNIEKEYLMLKEKTLNLLGQQSFVSSVLCMEGLDLNEKNKYNYDVLMNLFFFALELYVCLDESDNHRSYFVKERIRNMDEKEITKLGIDYLKEISSKVLDLKGEHQRIPKSLIRVYEKRIKKLCEFIQIFKPELKDIEIVKKEDESSYVCSLKMIYEDYSLDKEFESRGIKKLMELFNYLDNASRGNIVFIDELDSNINDIYLDKVIEHFILYGKGQLCFTAHNLSPMSVLKGNKNAINFISSINTVHAWTNNGNQSPENAYKNGFIEDSPFNVDASDFLGIIGG